VHALRSAGLDRAGQPGVGQGLSHQKGGADGYTEPASLGRIDIEHQVCGPAQVIDAAQRRVILDRPLVGEPQQCSAIIA